MSLTYNKMGSIKITNEYVNKQLALADKTENHFADWLRSRGYLDIEVTEGVFSEYDVSGFRDGLYTSFEIKTASKSERYGTYFIEYFQSGKPSGMQKTTADYQIYYDEQGYVRYMSTRDLNKYIKDNDLELIPTKYISYGTTVSALGYKVPVKEFIMITKHDIKI